MKIRDLMIQEPITISENASITEALERMKTNSIRHLPVVESDNRLKGFVTLADLKQGLIPSMVGDVSLSDLMITDPITVHPDDDLEVAARLIYKYKISGMPVIEDGSVAGIITESDILRAFIDMMGILSGSSRFDVVMKEGPDAFREALQIINDSGAEIINVGMSARHVSKRIYFFRLTACKTQPIQEALEDAGFEVLHAMD